MKVLKKRRVLFLYSSDPSPMQLERMSLLYESGGYDVHLAYWHRHNSTLNMPFPCGLPGINFIPIGLPDPRGNIVRRIILTLLFMLATWNYVRKLNPQIIHTFYPDMLAVARLILIFYRSTVLMYEIPDIPSRRPTLFARIIYRKLLRRVSTIFITSKKYKTAFLDRYKLVENEENIVFMPVCPQTSHFSDYIRRNEQDLVVGYLGNFRGTVQINNLVKATKAVRQSGRNVRVLFAGVGRDSNLVINMDKKYPFVDFHGPFNYWTEISDLYSKIDIIFSVYPNELTFTVALGNRFCDGVVCSIPLILSKGSYMAEIANSENFGWAVEPDSQKELELVLSQAYDDRDQLEKRGKSNESFRRRFSFDYHAPKFLKSYSHVVNHDIRR